MGKILSIGVLRSSMRQNLAPVALCKVEWFWVKIINFWDLKILKKFFHFYLTLQRATGASFCRMELLRTPIERILSILSRFETYEHVRGICTHQAHQSGGTKLRFQFFSPISACSQTTNEILHKNVSNHTDVFLLKNFRKSWISGKKSMPYFFSSLIKTSKHKTLKP